MARMKTFCSCCCFAVKPHLIPLPVACLPGLQGNRSLLAWYQDRERSDVYAAVKIWANCRSTYESFNTPFKGRALIGLRTH